MKIIQFFKKLFYRLFKKGRTEEAPRPERWCGNCAHTNKGFDDEPCCYCDKASDWEARE